MCIRDSPGGVPSEHPPIDPRNVSNRPEEGSDGVVWIPNFNDTTPSLDVTVWDMQQVGEWMYVGGEFLNVVENNDNEAGQLFPQAHLARFSISTGEWDPTFRPVLDGNVHALEVNERGRLLVGGEFTNINGVPETQGLAAINPTTGAVDTTFEAWVERPFFPEGRAIVRELEVVGDLLYIVGNYSHINGTGGQRVRVNKASRVTSNFGTVDATWAPVIDGGSVWGIGIDQDRGRAILAGRFTSVNGEVAEDSVTVDTITGATVQGLAPHPKNANQEDVYDAEYAGNRVWLAQSQHTLALLNGQTHVLEEWNSAGDANDSFGFQGTSTGGDFQFVEKIGDFVYSGCHCNEQFGDNTASFDLPNHYSSVTGNRTTHVVSMAYHLDGGLVEESEFDIGGNVDGGWSVASDTTGCLWLGGDIIDGGFFEPGGRVFARGFARFCDDTPIVAPTNLQAVTAEPGLVEIEWDAVPTAVGYLVFRNGSFIGFTTEPNFADNDVVSGTSYFYDVRAENARGEQSPKSDFIEVIPGGVDDERPTTPENLQAVNVTDAGVALTWEPSTDNVAIQSYLVFRDGGFIGFTEADVTTYIDSDVEQNATYAYTLRSVDVNDNRSFPTDELVVTIGGPDIEPPSIPGNLRTGEITDTTIELLWDDSTDNVGLQSYLVFRDGAFLAWRPAGVTSFVDDTGLAQFASYTYTVRAVDLADNRSDTAALVVQFGEPDTEPPSIPQNLVALNVTDTSVELSWDASTDNGGLQSYLVFRDGAFLDWRPAGTTTLLDEGLTPLITYTYQVRAVDLADNRSERSEPLAVAVGGADVEPPSVPANLRTGIVTESSVELIWDASTDNVGLQSYLVFRDGCLLYTSPSPRDATLSRMPSSA